MIDLYTADTPNGHRVELMLEEVGLPYSKYTLSLSRGEHRTEGFRKLNPSARIPVIADHDPTVSKGGEAFILTQTAAILLYLAEKTGRLLPVALEQKVRALEWLSFDATDMAPTRFDAFWLSLSDHHEASSVLKDRAMQFYSVYDQQLASHEFLAGHEYSVADVAAYPWARSMEHAEMNQLEHVQRWMQQVAERPACRKVFNSID